MNGVLPLARRTVKPHDAENVLRQSRHHQQGAACPDEDHRGGDSTERHGPARRTDRRPHLGRRRGRCWNVTDCQSGFRRGRLALGCVVIRCERTREWAVHDVGSQIGRLSRRLFDWISFNGRDCCVGRAGFTPRNWNGHEPHIRRREHAGQHGGRQAADQSGEQNKMPHRASAGQTTRHEPRHARGQRHSHRRDQQVLEDPVSRITARLKKIHESSFGRLPARARSRSSRIRFNSSARSPR